LRYPILLLLLLCCTTSCKQYTPENLPEARLHFGSKGGMAGGDREYILLLDKGKLLFSDEYGSELETVGRFTKEELAAVTADLAGMSFSKKENPPGNYNTSLAYHHDGGIDRLRWSQPGGAPTPEVKTCYNHLMAAVRRLRKTE